MPQTLTPLNSSLYSYDSTGKPYADSAGNIKLKSGWLSWNINVPRIGFYSLSSVTTGTGGTYSLLMDENTIISGSSGGILTGSTSLVPGIHCVKIKSTGNVAFQISKIAVAEMAAPSAPTLNAAVFSNAECALSWNTVAGASGYKVSYGPISGGYTNSVDVGQATSTVLKGLDNSQLYFLAVYCYDAAGHCSLLSNEIRSAAHSTNSQLLVNFEGLAYGSTQSLWTFGGMNFTTNSSGSLMVLGTASGVGTGYPGNWPSNVLWSMYWGRQHFITATSGTTFDLYSLDLLTISNTPSARITGYDSSGYSFSRVVNFGSFDANGDATASVVLDWTKLTQVIISWSSVAGGGDSGRYGGIDNVLFNKTQSLPTAPSNLTATAVSSSQVNLVWNDNSGNEGGFIIDRSTQNDFSANLTSYFIIPSGSSTATYSDVNLLLTNTTVYYYRVRALSGAGDSTNTGTAWVAPAGLPSIDYWRLNHFGFSGNLSVANDLANPSGDGISNLMKYALGLNPNVVCSRTSLPQMGVQVSGTNRYLTLTLTGSANDVVYNVQGGSDLSQWSTLYSSTIGTSPGTITVIDTVPISSTSKRFIRLQITKP